jgi:hypothetical protein
MKNQSPPAQASDCATCEGHGEVSVQASDEPMRAALIRARAAIVKNRPALTLSRDATIAEYFALLSSIDAALGTQPKGQDQFSYKYTPNTAGTRMESGLEGGPRATADVERDAARHQWHRKPGNHFWLMGHARWNTPEEFDRAIDAAIAATRTQEQS